MLESLKLSLHISYRNWMVYKKDFVANISPAVADPALILISLGLGLGAFLSEIEGMSYLEFLAPGLIIATALFTSFFESSYGFYIRMTFEHIFKAMLTTPIGYKEIIYGEIIWVGLKGAVMAFAVSLLLSFFGLMKDPELLVLVPFVGFLVAVPCGAIGLIASALVRNINQFQTVYSFLIAPLLYLSGIFYPVGSMNLYIKFVADLFPVIHGVQMAQAIFWNTNVLESILFHGSIVLVQSVVLCTISFYLIKRKLIL